MPLSKEAWDNLKWGLAVLVLAFLLYMGKLENPDILIGVLAGALVPTTSIMQKLGAVKAPK